MNNNPIPFPSRDACLKFAGKCYAQLTTRCGNPFLQQSIAVADRVDALLSDHLMMAGIILPNQRLVLDSAYCGGLLHGVLQVAPYACFEQIVEIANIETAQYVGAITADCRQPRPQRHRELIARLYESPLPAQAIKLAEVLVETEELIPVFSRLRRKEAKQRFRDWCIAAQEVLAALRKLIEEEAFESHWRRLQETLSQLIKVCDNLAQRERILANIARNNANRRTGASA